MPIRMTDDPQDQQEFNDNSGGGSGFPGGGGGGGGLWSLLPLLFGLFRGKGLILLVAILVGGYFFLNHSGGCNLSQVAQQLATGGILDPAQFRKAAVYEPISLDDPNNAPLPESVNLQRFAPQVGDQGQQGSCVAWSSAYAARTILESARTGQPGDKLRFSPAFLYNQIGMDGCDGSYIVRAMEFMTQKGSVPYNAFEYTDQDCSRQPEASLVEEARQYRMHGFNRLSQGDRTDVIDLNAIRQNLAQGAPVVVGMMVGPSFMKPMMGQDLWEPQPGDKSLTGFGGHAMCVVGYDDKKYGGAFLLMNSWGPQWGNNGFAWIRYGDFNYFVREAYGLDPMQPVGAAANTPLDCEIGLMQVTFEGGSMQTRGYIPLRLAENDRFETTVPVSPGTRFKVEIKNSTECYIYVFGKETDGTCYTLFPYPTPEDPSRTRYSPYCGITGYRLFPKDKSMTPDSVGHRDEMAIVVSKNPLDWSALNRQISQNPQADFGDRVEQALGGRLMQKARFETGSSGTLKFHADPGDNKVVATIISIHKP
ncbi:MAG TPA: C1 family peptidase [Chitinophagaceae bacterium]|nr:C1 family peptidase [Chitinophagaceae bacterium]